MLKKSLNGSNSMRKVLTLSLVGLTIGAMSSCAPPAPKSEKQFRNEVLTDILIPNAELSLNEYKSKCAELNDDFFCEMAESQRAALEMHRAELSCPTLDPCPAYSAAMERYAEVTVENRMDRRARAPGTRTYLDCSNSTVMSSCQVRTYEDGEIVGGADSTYFPRSGTLHSSGW